MFITKFIKIFRSPLITGRSLSLFSKTNNQNQNQPVRNQNYINSKKIINKKIEKQNYLQNLLIMLNRDDGQSLKYLLMANTLMMGIIPFYPQINIAITILNSGFILNHLGHQFKKYLLLINNQQTQSLMNFRSPQLYLKIIFQNIILMTLQSALLSFSYYGACHAVSVVWFAICIYEKIIPKIYWPIFIALALVIIFNFSSIKIKEFLVNAQKVEINIPAISK